MQWLLFDMGGTDCPYNLTDVGPYPVAAIDFTAELYRCHLHSTGAFQTRYSKNLSEKVEAARQFSDYVYDHTTMYGMLDFTRSRVVFLLY